MTPKSGNILAVDSRYPKILRAAYQSLIYAVEQALQKHELVYFVNISGNHDIVGGHTIREIITARFADNDRVIIDQTATPVKYYQKDKLLLQFFHGDGMKMKDAGEVMAHDMQATFSESVHRFSHSGHTHKDAVYDGRLCKVESHRNIAPLNAWAHNMGYRRQLGTMKSITYDTFQGEVLRNTYNINL